METPPASAMAQARLTRNPLRKLYFWTLHWAATRHADKALFALSFAESSFFPVPPDVLLAAMCFSRPRRWARYAFWCSVASVLGGIFGYYLGRPLRFFLVAGLIRAFGERIRPFLESRLEWAVAAVTVAGILGFVAIKYLR